MKHNRKEQYKYKLGKVPKIEPKELYIADSNCNLRHIDRGEVTKGGISFDSLKELEMNKTKDLADIRNLIGQARDSLIGILKEFGYNTPSVELKTLINDLYRLTIIKPTYQYDLLHLDDDGYIVGNELIDNNDLVVNLISDKPNDIDKGYYKYENGEVVKDNKKYEEYWSII